jgi:hypothetical protein
MREHTMTVIPLVFAVSKSRGVCVVQHRSRLEREEKEDEEKVLRTHAHKVPS